MVVIGTVTKGRANGPPFLFSIETILADFLDDVDLMPVCFVLRNEAMTAFRAKMRNVDNGCRIVG